MANNPSTEKRIRQNEKRRQRNKSLKTKIKNKRKEIQNAIEAESPDRAENSLQELYGLCDRAAKKGAIHENKASRIKSRMTKRVNELGGAEEA